MFEVLLVADYLQVTSVVQQCCDYIQAEFVECRFGVQPYCRIYTIADRHGLVDLQEATQCKMAWIFKSVMQWIKFKKAKVIGAVCLGLVDIKHVMKELNTEQIKQVPEINVLLNESLLYSHIPSSSTFGEEKTKLRSSGPVRNALFFIF